MPNAATAKAWIDLPLPGGVAELLAIPGFEPVDDLHLTLAFFGLASARDDWEVLAATLANFTHDYAAPFGEIDRYDYFPRQANGDQVLFATVSMPSLLAMREALVEAIGPIFVPSADFGEWRPHITLANTKAEKLPTPIEERLPIKTALPVLSLHLGRENRYDFAFFGKEKLES